MTLAQMVFMKETSAATILQRKTKCLRSKLDSGLTSSQTLSRAIVRPTKTTLLSPINLLLSLASVFINGLLFLLVTTFPMVFEQQYGFSARGMGLAFLGNILFFLVTFAYLVDAFTVYAASAIAANTVLRSLGGTFIPLAGPSIYQALGLRWGNSLLAGLALGFTPALAFLYVCGEEIRLRCPIIL